MSSPDLPSGKTNAAADIQETDAFRRVKLMCGYGVHIDGKVSGSGLHICLYAVRMKHGVRCKRANLCRNPIQIIHAAKLVVYVHNADKRRIRIQDFRQSINIHGSIRAERRINKFCVKQLRIDSRCFIYRRMLDLCRNNSFLPVDGAQRTEKSHIVRFRSARCIDDLFRIGADR